MTTDRHIPASINIPKFEVSVLYLTYRLPPVPKRLAGRNPRKAITPYIKVGGREIVSYETESFAAKPPRGNRPREQAMQNILPSVSRFRQVVEADGQLLQWQNRCVSALDCERYWVLACVSVSSFKRLVYLETLHTVVADMQNGFRPPNVRMLVLRSKSFKGKETSMAEAQ